MIPPLSQQPEPGPPMRVVGNVTPRGYGEPMADITGVKPRQGNPGRQESGRSGSWPDGRVTVTGAIVEIESLELEDAVLADLLRRSDDPVALVERIMAVGTRGVVSMGATLDLADVEARIRQTAHETSAASEARVADMLNEARTAITQLLDPTAKDSFTSTTIEEFAAWRDGLFERFDPERQSSHTGRTIAAIASLLGPGGALESRLTEALDPSRAGSGMGQIADLLERRISEIRDLVAEERGRTEEAERGTMKGFDYEDEIEDALRTCARQMGATVERTSRSSGDIDRAVGDFVVEFDTGVRVVVEAKNKRSLSLTGGSGILGELDLAMSNRDATVAVCVSKHLDAFPQEVGPINVYGRRVLVTDPGDGTMVWVALRWARQLAALSSPATIEFNAEAVRDGLQRLSQLAERFRSNRSHLTQIKSSVVAVHESLGDMRRDLLDLADDLAAEIFRSDPAATVVDIAAAG